MVTRETRSPKRMALVWIGTQSSLSGGVLAIQASV